MATTSVTSGTNTLNTAATNLLNGSTTNGSATPTTTGSISATGGGTLSITGLASGMDTSSIVNQLVAIQKNAQVPYQQKESANYSKLTSWLTLTPMLTTLQSSLKTLESPSTFMGTSASFTNSIAGNPDITTLTTTTNVAQGSHSLKVNALAAQQQSWSTQGQSSTSAAINDFMSLTITPAGTGKAQVFTQNTLSGLSTAINNANAGVSATIVNTAASGAPANYRMELTATNSGTANSFTTSTQLISTGVTGAGVLDFTNSQTSADASITIDGQNVTRSSNSISDVIPGLTMTLSSIGSGTINLTNNTSSTVTNVQSFVTAYNSVMGYINQQNSFNPSSTSQQPLFGDPTLLTIQTSLRSLVSGGGTGIGNSSNVYPSLSSIGINTNWSASSGSSVSLNTATLTTALQSNASAVQNLFVPGGTGAGKASAYSLVSATGNFSPGNYDTQVSNTGQLQMKLHSSSTWITMNSTNANTYVGPVGSKLDGVVISANSLTNGDTGTMTIWGGAAQMMDNTISSFTDSNNGLITTTQNSINQSNTGLQKQIDKITTMASKLQSSLTKQFTALEVTMSQLTAQQQYLTNQLNNLPSWNVYVKH
jgi:flagellar hook-associated protein 2